MLPLAGLLLHFDRSVSTDSQMAVAAPLRICSFASDARSDRTFILSGTDSASDRMSGVLRRIEFV